MNAYPHASTSIHPEASPTAKRLVRDDGTAFVSVSGPARVTTYLWLAEGRPAVETRLEGDATLFLSPDEAVALAAGLIKAARTPRIEVVA